MSRPTGFSFGEIAREAGAMLAIAGVGVALLWFFWLRAPGGGETRMAGATVVLLSAPPEYDSVPGAKLVIRLDGGGSWTIRAPMSRVLRCRTGDRITVKRSTTNGGVARWDVMPGGCIGP